MPKKLYVGNYRFDASEQIVYVQGNVQPEKFLIITNITDNTIIYNFADLVNKAAFGLVIWAAAKSDA